MSNKYDFQQIAIHIAQHLAQFTTPTMELRNDVGAIQIDYATVSEQNREIPAIMFKFMVVERMEIKVLVKIPEFKAKPVAYLKDLIVNVRGIRHDAMLRRNLILSSLSNSVKRGK